MICSKTTATDYVSIARKSSTLFLCLLLLPLLTHCSTATQNISSQQAIYSTPTPAELQQIHSPAFFIKKPEQTYNLIGSPRIGTKDCPDKVIVDPSHPVVFYEVQTFSTPKDSYINLVYRIHFEKVPFSFSKPHLTTGNNPGILIIYTTNKRNDLLLVTTVHSCGCYLAFFPTDKLPSNAYPSNWPTSTQDVYGHTLPSLLDVSSHLYSGKITFTLEGGNHRISNATVLRQSMIKSNLKHSLMTIQPMSSLYNLPYKDTTVSFFELEGSRKGYTKNNMKILERLLISWWAFDLHVGEDKAYGKDDKSGIPLYTSLKFWQRNASDLKNFPQFLSYWGWKL